MRKQRERHTKAGPMGSGLLHFGERRKRKGGGGKGRKGQRRLEDRILRNLCFFQITVL